MKKLITKVIAVSTICVSASYADSLNIATLAQAEIQAAVSNPMGNYLNWQPIGVCTYLHFDKVWPYVMTKPYVQHYIPDLAVSVFPRFGDNPWTEANSIIDVPLEAAGQATIQSAMGMRGGDGTTGATSAGNHDLGNRFYEVDVFGNPAAMAFAATSQFMTVRGPATTPYTPYYSSLADKYLWHDPILEITTHPQALIPGVDNEGDFIAPWGSLYPRYGIITQPAQYKSAAMIALRATHIAVRQGQAHIYMPAPKQCDNKIPCQVVKDPDINDNDSVEFQRVFPGPAQTTFDKDDFGKNDLMDFSLTSYGQDIAQNGDDRYVWLAWRKYQGCVPDDGGILISAIKFQ